jgi:Secretion system C-terminal sorting domain
LLKLVEYIDSLGYYCNLFDDYFAQEAIWRITDNVQPYDSEADSLLISAGVNINQSFDFPKMTYNYQDSISSRYIPDQLFATNIEPKYTDAKLNEQTNFAGSVFTPSVGHFTSDFIWILSSPNSNSNQLVVSGSSSTLTPLQRGVYSLNLEVTVKDSTGAERNFQSPTTSYAVVSDKFTETFEHNNLSDLFSWKTYGDAPWTITNKTAQTGSFSIQAGNIGSGQSSTLEISIDLPSDSVIEFAFKTNISLGFLTFNIDSDSYGYYSEFNDWTFQSYNLQAGKHVLKWIYQNSGPNTDNAQGIWLDNIFFPTNAAHFTSVESSENIPITFNLFQNYPNPFNPSTTINFVIPQSSFVNLKVYDVLGKEVATLIDEYKQAGKYETEFNAANLPSGVYFYKLQAGSFISTKKMILLK